MNDPEPAQGSASLTPHERRKEFLESELRQLKERRDRRSRITRIALFLGLVCVAAAPLIYLQFEVRYTALAVLLYGLTFLSLPLIRPLGPIDSSIKEVENELDLLEIEETSAEQRAEKLFKLHQIELKKYYDQTLRHSSWIFVVGILCILIGFGIIGASLVFVSSRQTNLALSEKIVTATLGAVSGVLANFIAVIYLKMYSETIKSLTEFHNRLVATHHLHFGNFLASKLENLDIRQETLSQMALKLIK